MISAIFTVIGGVIEIISRFTWWFIRSSAVEKLVVLLILLLIIGGVSR